MGNTRLLEAQRVSDLRAQFAFDIDSGLMWWYRIDHSLLCPALNILTGTEVIPQCEVYVRRLAAIARLIRHHSMSHSSSHDA